MARTPLTTPAQGSTTWWNWANQVGTELETVMTGAAGLGSALPGTRLSCVWNGTAWTYGGTALSARPSSRTDIFFELYGAPAATADPAWMINGDSRVDL